MRIRASFLGAALAAAPALFLVSACGGANQVHATESRARAPQQQQHTASVAPVVNTPTASTVHISEEILRACNIPDADAYFAFDSAHLTAFDRAPLDALAACFENGPMKGHKMTLVGHADPRGTTEYNMTLGQSRADAVENYLSTRGLSRVAIASTSRGSMDATGHDETGWAHDRCVEVVLAN